MKQELIKYQYNFFKKALTISFTRIVGILLLTTDIISLKNSSQEIANFTIATQFIQVFLIIIVSSTTGINILSNKLKNKGIMDIFFTYYFILSFIVCSLSLLILKFLHYQNYDVILIYVILASSLLFLAGYLSIISYLESKGLEKLVFLISSIFLVWNYLFNQIFILVLPIGNAICVALSTLFIRVLTLIVFYIIFKYKFNFWIKFKIDFTIFKQLFKFSATYMLTSAVFTGTFAIIIYISSTYLDANNMGLLGITLNFMNIVSIFFVGLNISTTIELAKTQNNENSLTTTILSTISYFIIINILFLVLAPIFAKIFVKGYTSYYLINKLTFILMISLIIVFFDSIVNYLISFLRVFNISITPPLFKLPIVFLGLPLIFYLIKYFSILGIFYSLIISSSVSLIITIIYFILNKYKIESINN